MPAKSLNTKLITAVYSSVANSLNKASSHENKGASPPKGDSTSGNGWVTVTNKKAPQADKQAPPPTQDPAKEVLHPLCSHVPSASMSSKKEDKQPKVGFNNVTKATKSAKRNARRSRKRLEARQTVHQTGSLVTSSEKVSQSLPDPLADTQISSSLLSLPYAIITNDVMAFLGPGDNARIAQTCKQAKRLAEEGFLWRSMFRDRFAGKVTEASMREWKLAYQLALTHIIDQLRCAKTKQSFFDDVLGVGVNYTVNPKTRSVDYIDLSQDLLSQTAFDAQNVRADVFGAEFKLFLPLYFSEDHFQRALPRIKATIQRMGSNPDASRFNPLDILDVVPKIYTTFVVLLSDEGIAASKKSFDGLTRIHRLFMALCHEYPALKAEAVNRLKRFRTAERHRTKSVCPNLGAILPLLLVVDEEECCWKDIQAAYLTESFDRSVLWACKKYPQLQNVGDKPEAPKKAEERIELTKDAMTINLRLLMFNVSFLQMSCKGKIRDRARTYDLFFGQPDSAGELGGGSTKETVSLVNFRDKVNFVLSANTWTQFFDCVGARRPETKANMAKILRSHVKSSERKGYHKRGMDYSRIQRSGTSKILSKGQQYAVVKGLKNVTFSDSWSYNGDTKFLDASCLLYQGKTLVETIDYSNTRSKDRSVQHSGDVMHVGGGVHTINIDLEAMDSEITTCMFVLSAWASAKLSDILSPTISFNDASNDALLCSYDLDSHDKVPHLTSVIMCKLHRSTRTGGWHVQAIGESHRGAADNYKPIFQAVQKLL